MVALSRKIILKVEIERAEHIPGSIISGVIFCARAQETMELTSLSGTVKSGEHIAERRVANNFRRLSQWKVISSGDDI